VNILTIYLLMSINLIWLLISLPVFTFYQIYFDRRKVSTFYIFFHTTIHRLTQAYKYLSTSAMQLTKMQLN